MGERYELDTGGVGGWRSRTWLKQAGAEGG